MATRNFSNRTLFISDNLPVLEGMNSETIDLVLIDPPFNSKRQFQGIGQASKAKFKDIWSWREDVHPEWMPKLREHNRPLAEVVEAAYHASDPSMAAYIAFMSIRVLELHRVLKSTGSMHLHCDPTASHYLKAMMDSIFGPSQFRNEIIWQRTITRKGNLTRRLARDSDVLLHYSKSSNYIWHAEAVTIPYDLANLDKKTARKYHSRDEDGRLYQLTAITAPVQDSSSSRTFELMGVTRTWRWSKERMEREVAAGRVVQTKPGNVPRQIRYLDEQKGKTLNNIWLDIPAINSQAKERIGWPAQKPLKLYRRLIEASSNEGDMVLDAFAGCATTCVAAEMLGRQWVGIDIDEEAETVTLDRLRRETRLLEDGANSVTIRRDPPYRTPDPAPTPTFETPKRLQRRQPMPPLSEARKYLAQRDGAFCQGCGFEPPNGWLDYLEVDHQKPKADGGTNAYDNLVLLCSPCNRRKGHFYTLSGLRNATRQEGRILEKRW